MKVTDRKPVPIYEVECSECHSKIRYKASEVAWSHITCPICGLSIWATAISPVEFQEVDDGGKE